MSQPVGVYIYIKYLKLAQYTVICIVDVLF